MVGANIEIYNGRSTIIGFVLSMFNPIFIKQQELKFKAIVCLSFEYCTNFLQGVHTHTHTQHLC